MNAGRIKAERLRELLHYDPESGVFTWKVSRGGSARAGSTAGSPDAKGYIKVKINGHFYKAHRLAWLWVHGVWTDKAIDHQNRLKNDNRIANLREVSASENQQNRALPRHNTSGFPGVCWHKKASRWQAQIQLNGKNRHLGLFGTPEDAHDAYLAAAAEMHTCNSHIRSKP